MKRDGRVYIEEVLECCEKVEEYKRGGAEEDF